MVSKAGVLVMFVFQVRRDEKAEFSLLVKQALKKSLHSAVRFFATQKLASHHLCLAFASWPISAPAQVTRQVTRRSNWQEGTRVGMNVAGFVSCGQLHKKRAEHPLNWWEGVDQ